MPASTCAMPRTCWAWSRHASAAVLPRAWNWPSSAAWWPRSNVSCRYWNRSGKTAGSPWRPCSATRCSRCPPARTRSTPCNGPPLAAACPASCSPAARTLPQQKLGSLPPAPMCRSPAPPCCPSSPSGPTWGLAPIPLPICSTAPTTPSPAAWSRRSSTTAACAPRVNWPRLNRQSCWRPTAAASWPVLPMSKRRSMRSRAWTASDSGRMKKWRRRAWHSTWRSSVMARERRRC